jgi:integrase/recombinase XerD
MKLKSESTIIERAIQTIEGFSAVDERIRQQTILRGQSRSTFENYIRQIARVCLHFGRLPETITEDEINGYLTGLARDPRSNLIG